MAHKPLSPAESRAAAASAWRVAFWGIGLYALARLAALLLQSMSMPAAVAHPAQPVPTTGAIARRAGIGAGVGVIAAAVVVGFLATTHAVILERTTPAASAIIVAIITAGFYAMRDELLLHGLVMRALVTVDVPILKVLACGLTSAAAAYGELGAAEPLPIAVQGLLGIVFGSLWVRDRGAWPAWGAHTAWLFTTSLLMQGGLFEARVFAGTWGGGDAGPLGGTAAVIALLPLAAGALAGTARQRRTA